MHVSRPSGRVSSRRSVRSLARTVELTAQDLGPTNGPGIFACLDIGIPTSSPFQRGRRRFNGLWRTLSTDRRRFNRASSPFRCRVDEASPYVRYTRHRDGCRYRYRGGTGNRWDHRGGQWSRTAQVVCVGRLSGGPAGLWGWGWPGVLVGPCDRGAGAARSPHPRTGGVVFRGSGDWRAPSYYKYNILQRTGWGFLAC